MSSLPYASTALPLPGPAAHGPLLERAEPPAAPDPARACELALERPAGRPGLSAWASRGDRVAVVVPDPTRNLAPALLERTLALLRDAGARPFVRIANGTHRRLTEAELERRVPSSLGVARGDRDCDDASAHATLGEALGVEARIDAEAAGADKLVLLGPVSFHYLAGFGGGAKLLAPGLADRATAEAVHRRCLDPRAGRDAKARLGVFPHENPLHRAIAEVARRAPPVFSAVSLEDAQGRLVGVFAGEPAAAHHHACLSLEGHYRIEVPRLACLVVSAGGAPYDRDFVQAHKALEAAAAVVEPGGAIVWAAACGEGLSERMRRWLALGPAEALEAELRRRFDIGGHTAFAMRSKAERFRILAVTELGEAECALLGVAKVASLEEAVRRAWVPGRSAVARWGARYLLA